MDWSSHVSVAKVTSGFVLSMIFSIRSCFFLMDWQLMFSTRSGVCFLDDFPFLVYFLVDVEQCIGFSLLVNGPGLNRLVELSEIFSKGFVVLMEYKSWQTVVKFGLLHIKQSHLMALSSFKMLYVPLCISWQFTWYGS